MIIKKEIVRLDIDLIPAELYDDILEEFKRQFGEEDCVYVDWELNASKEK